MTENSRSQPENARAAQTTTRLAGAQSPPQQRVGGRYDLGDLLGEGGAARVYYARDTVLDRVVAVKLLRDEYSADADFVARFYREARAIASLSHPNIVDIYDYGTHGDTYFIAMQFVEGSDLKSIIRREGRLAPERTIALADGLLRGLGAAHERGIIHRDVKPQNLLVRARDGQVKLTDFGVARALGATQNTAAGTTFGTAHYMAPEQANGGGLSPATDIYAVGVVLFEALSGRLPFDGETPLQIALQHMRAPVPSLAAAAPELPPALARVVERALAKEPHNRYPSAEAMRLALHEALAAPAAAVGAVAAPVGGGLGQTRSLPPMGVTPPPVARAAARPARPTARPAGAGCVLPLIGALIVALLIGVVALARNLTAPARPTATVAAAAGPSPTLAGAIVPTAIAPTATSAPPTNTAVPPTATVVPPAAAVPVVVPPTATAVPPTPQPPTATPVPPTPTPQRGNATGNDDGEGDGQGKPLRADDIIPEQIQGAYRRDDGKLYGRPAVALYGSGTRYNQGTVNFRAENVPSGEISLLIVGLDDERDARCQFQVVLNGTTIFDAANTFPNTPTTDNGEGGKQRYWEQMTIRVPAGLLREGANTLVLRNRTPGSNLGIPYILISDITFTNGR